MPSDESHPTSARSENSIVGYPTERSALNPLDTMIVFMSDNGAEGAAYEGGSSA